MAEITYTFCDSCNLYHDMSVERRGRGFYKGSYWEAFSAQGWAKIDPPNAVYEKSRHYCPECYLQYKEQLEKRSMNNASQNGEKTKEGS